MTRRAPALVLEMPLAVDPEVCAVVFDPTSPEIETRGFARVYDDCYSWQAALSYVQSGYVVIAIGVPDEPGRHPFMTPEELQKRIDFEDQLRVNCFGGWLPSFVGA